MLGRITLPSVQTNDDGSVLYTWDNGGYVSVDASGNVTAVSDTSPLSNPQRFAQQLRAQQGATTVSQPFDVPYGMDVTTANAIESFAPGATTIIAQNQTPGESWVDTAQKILTGLVMTEQQRQLMQLNIERARQGLPPIDINRYTGVGVNVGLSQGTQQLVLYLALGAGALILLNSLMKR